jgi:FkbM family methyltransferase
MGGERPVTPPVFDLVYDVGMHNGDDSAYYLHSGFRVVAIEANPTFVERARSRFAAEIKQQRMTVLQVGIAEGYGEASFWVCEDHSDWSSFDRSIASRSGSRHHEIHVPLRPFGDILREYGAPRYCKIDIEGNDHHCLAAMTPETRPDFVSVELSLGPLLEQLADTGYDAFKVIHQLSFSPPNRRIQALKDRAPHRWLGAGIERGYGLLRGRLHEDGWYFRMGSSGPLHDRTAGRWLSLAQAANVVAFLQAQYKTGAIGLTDWYDIHATSDATLTARSPG